MNIRDVPRAAGYGGCWVCGRALKPGKRLCIVWNIETGDLKPEADGLRDERTDGVAFIGTECAKHVKGFARTTW